ncbi:cold-shock protein [Glycomyces sp. L485]|uniref:cold-shock protein n=1 Tax=Glycomyces sp. L485 TaxID=2909235 RepID=UPI001F4AD6B4|nr:cold-shock protein [Glycomyces sp. L485]MCH7231627.1 cold-shock protein [Glycomyces sp. L485]
MQGTVASFNEDTSGEVVLDSGRRVPFDAAAFAASGLRFLRPGQRVQLDRDETGSIIAIRILTMHP